ncbi:SRPBCC domain-containing protein [Streptomyces sp. NPDC058067]|uniref:SRPBCC domain-containing protein n=1 Tax=Streptomyces sp. NPDC058067 TaxID=3346324 RepID=UPI0036ED43E9
MSDSTGTEPAGTEPTALVEPGTSRTEGRTHTLHFTIALPHPVEQVWAAVATAEGLPGWLAAADVLEPRLGGTVTLRWLTNGEVHTGHVTAWDGERVAEYTLEGLHGRMRFHLEPTARDATTLRFTNEFDGDDELRLDRLAGWHDHFEHLVAALDGHPTDERTWAAWTPDRWLLLRGRYAAAE